MCPVSSTGVSVSCPELSSQLFSFIPLHGTGDAAAPQNSFSAASFSNIASEQWRESQADSIAFINRIDGICSNISNQDKLTCQLCGRHFHNIANLRRHLKIHYNDRRFQCSSCGMAFYRSDHLKLHKARCQKQI